MNRNYLLFAIIFIVLTLGCKKDNDVAVENPTNQDDDMGMVDDMDEDATSKIDTMTTANGIQFVRTPDKHFENLPDWPYAYQYIEIDGLRQAYAEAGPADGPVVLLLHGQPSWSYLYRKMMPVLAEAGYRAIAMDHLGMGRSDKPIDIEDYSYLGHNERVESFIQALDLQNINLFVQDWGSLIGLRVAGLNPDWFATISVGDGDLPVIPAGIQPIPTIENPNEILDLELAITSIPAQQISFYNGCDIILGGGEDVFGEGFSNWAEYAMKAAAFKPSEILETLTWFDLPEAVEAAYDAPFPDRAYMAGVRTFPYLINDLPGINDAAWAGLTAYEKPFLTIWAANDPGTLSGCETQQNLIDNVPGAAGKPHTRLPEASHFLQDDQGTEIARRLVNFYKGDYTSDLEEGGLGEGMQNELCEEDANLDPNWFCQIMLGYQRNGEIVAEVWGTKGLNLCPQQCLEALDLDAIKAETGALFVLLNGPRISLLEGESGSEEGEASEVRQFGGLEMRQIATLVMDPTELASGGNAPYTESIIRRNSTFDYAVGTEVYELISPAGTPFIMLSMSLMVNPDLTRANLPNLGSILDMPVGWRYQTRILEEPLTLITEGEATIVSDDLGNSYQERKNAGSDSTESETRVGFEIFEVKSLNEIIVWIVDEPMTIAEFEVLELPQGWLKNEPREGVSDGAFFVRSPTASVDGDFTIQEHFGYRWKHNATVIETGIELDDQGLLEGNYVAKLHTVTFNAGRTLDMLASPQGDRFILIARDANRTNDIPTIPANWQRYDTLIQDDWILELPNPTLNIRTDNEDSYQGPLDGVYEGNNSGENPSEICEDDFSLNPRRYCELLIGFQKNGAIEVEVWGTQGINRCPATCWEDLDLNVIKSATGALIVLRNGPRVWLPSGDAQFPQGSTNTSFFDGLEMRLLATLPVDPADVMSGNTNEKELYTESLVNRNTTYLYPAGTEVYELFSPEGKRYIMQSMSLEVNPDLMVNDLPNIASDLNLPNGWTYQASILNEDLRLVIEGEAFVIQDDLYNTYQLVTDESVQPDDGMGMNQGTIDYESTLAELDPLDKGGRWLALGIKEIQELEVLPAQAKEQLSDYLHTLALNPEHRCDTEAHEQLLANLAANNIPEEVTIILQNAITRVCDPLIYHEGYWVAEINNPSIAFPIEIINDVHIDAAAKSITVYAQARINGQVFSPAQVGPNECTTLINGDSVGFHPNAVYINGSGAELSVADGTGAWWVKHAWVLGGEGYYNWELSDVQKEYGEGLWVTGILLEDDITMKAGDLDESDGGGFNLRQPILDTNPISFQLTSGINLENPLGVINMECTTEISAFDGLARSCPVLIE